MVQPITAAVLLLFVASTARVEAQTLTATRGLFNTKPGLTQDQIKEAIKDSVAVALLADGNVRTVLSGKGGDAPTPVAGALGISFGRSNSNLTVLINVVGSADTVKGDFASSLLPPTSGGATSNHLSFLVDFRQLFPKLDGWGWHLYVSGAPAAWADTLTSGKPVVGGFVAAAGASLSREVYNQDVQGTSVSLVFDLGPTARAIEGNLTDGPTAEAFRERLLGTSKTFFVGGEAGMTLQVKEVRLGVSYYLFGGSIPGLSRGQAVFGFSVANGFFAGHASKVPPPASM